MKENKNEAIYLLPKQVEIEIGINECMAFNINKYSSSVGQAIVSWNDYTKGEFDGQMYYLSIENKCQSSTPIALFS